MSSLALIVTMPVMLIVAILVKLDSPGPVLYSQIRVGLNRRGIAGCRRSEKGRRSDDRRDDNKLGSLFRIYKFRTMRNDAEAKGAVWASVSDNRVTRLGKFLRKTRLDELPQFYNILMGDMSVIGPRPERPEFVQRLNESINSFGKRCNVKPGLTGLAQVRYSYASSIDDTKKKVKYDLIYLEKRCLLLDMKIFFSTFKTVLFARGAR